jgi:hypothetical protein
MFASVVQVALALVVALTAYYLFVPTHSTDLPRIGTKPSFLGNTSKSFFAKHSLELLEEGYAKVRLTLLSPRKGFFGLIQRSIVMDYTRYGPPIWIASSYRLGS